MMHCPVCWRDVDAVEGVVTRHVDTASWVCPMSLQPVPKCLLREAELEETAAQVMRLAADLRDDLAAFHAAVRNLDDRKVREWLIIALAAVDVDRPLSELLGWVTELNYVGAA